MKATIYIHLLIGFFGIIATAIAQPIITNQPTSITTLAGTTATFSVGVIGTPPLAFQWWYQGNGSSYPIAWETNTVLRFANVQSFGSSGTYFVVITNFEGAVTSVVATLTVLNPPKISVQPASQTASLFADATFRPLASGDAPLSYQWRFNNKDLSGMTNAILTVTNVQRADAGSYDLVVTNLSGSVTSQVAALTIIPFDSIFCFGFSWTATSGLSANGSSCGLNPPQWYQHRASNGPLWPEFLSTNLGLIYVEADNLGQCGATSLDILNQVSNYRIPPKPNLSLYCMWADGPDADSATLLRAITNQGFGDQLLQATILNNSNALNRLYEKGAREILVEVGTATPTNAPWNSQLLGTNSAALVSAYKVYTKVMGVNFADLGPRVDEISQPVLQGQ